MSERIVIVGGGPAGLAAARAYRDEGGRAAVSIFAAETHLPYRRPPLTKEFLRGELARAELDIETPSWFEENDVDLHLGAKVTALDLDRGIIEVAGKQGFGFDACVLATGSEPLRLPVPGGYEPGVMTIRSVEDSERLSRAVSSTTSVAVVGSGFIGCEAAASLAMRGARVTVVTMEDAPQSERLGAAAARFITAWLTEHGVRIVSGVTVEGFSGDGDRREVRLGGGKVVAADVVVCAVGVSARVSLAEEAGIEIRNGRIVTDQALRSSHPRVRAAGDIALALNARAGRHLPVEHWGEALNQGAVAGASLAGSEKEWDVAPGFWSTIGTRTVKQVAWGDGHDDVVVDGDARGFAIWYANKGIASGVLTHNRDEDYERGRKLVEEGAPLP